MTLTSTATAIAEDDPSTRSKGVYQPVRRGGQRAYLPFLAGWTGRLHDRPLEDTGPRPTIEGSEEVPIDSYQLTWLSFNTGTVWNHD